MVPLLAALLTPAAALADGMFVVPKFVWDKHKDINEPAQKAILVYDVGREDLILQVKYEGPVDEVGWLIPVPNLPTVEITAASVNVASAASRRSGTGVTQGQFLSIKKA